MGDDLLAFESVLVSTGFNANDDFFAADATFAARLTPAHKPVNVDHKSGNVVGHMVACRVVGEAPEGSDYPDNFSLATSAFVYAYWPQDDTKQEAADALVAELKSPPADKPWCVSMECRFRGFDYALLPAGADPLDATAATIVTRTDATKFLTKHLRRYGGGGAYAGQRLGRVLRNVEFTAVGFTRTPANPLSTVTGVSAGANSPPVYEPSSTSTRTDLGTPMTLDELKAELATTKAELAAAQSLKAKLDEMAATAAAAAAELATSKAELAAAKAALAAADATLAAAKAVADAATAEVARAAAEKLADERVALVKDAYGCDTLEKAKAAAAPLAALSDEAFAAHLKAMESFKAKPAAKPVALAAALDKTEPVAEAAAVLAPAASPADARTAALAAELAEFYVPEPATKTVAAKRK